MYRNPTFGLSPENGLVVQGTIPTIARQTLSKPRHQLTSLQDAIQQAGKGKHEGQKRGCLVRCSLGQTSVRSF